MAWSLFTVLTRICTTAKSRLRVNIIDWLDFTFARSIQSIDSTWVDSGDRLDFGAYQVRVRMRQHVDFLGSPSWLSRMRSEPSTNRSWKLDNRLYVFKTGYPLNRSIYYIMHYIPEVKIRKSLNDNDTCNKNTWCCFQSIYCYMAAQSLDYPVRQIIKNTVYTVNCLKNNK